MDLQEQVMVEVKGDGSSHRGTEEAPVTSLVEPSACPSGGLGSPATVD